MQKIRYLDCFAGVGGFALALEQSIGKENIEHIGYSEWDKFATKVYEEHFPGVKNYGDIAKVDIDNLPDIDLLTGGFPCTDVSVAGKQSLDGGRTILVEYLLQILEKKKPKYFVFENVKGLMSKKFDTFRNSIFDRIAEAGYYFDFKILNTKDFGLPQNRERIFIVGELCQSNNFKFPKGKPLTTFLKDILEEEVDEKYYLTDEQFNSLTYDSIKRIYDTIAPTLDTAQGGHRQPKIKVCHNIRSREFLGTGFKDISPTLCARDYKDPKQTIKIKNATKKGYIEAKPGDGIILDNPNSKTKRGRVKDGISGTLTVAGIDGIIENDFKIRKLTPVEYERLQGFPDGYTASVSNSQRYKQMGNAISVPVVKEIFKKLLTNHNSGVVYRHSPKNTEIKD